MSLYTILLLITLVVDMLCIYTVHNSEKITKVSSRWKDEYVYEPFKLPIILWLVIFIVMFIPAVNIIAVIVHVILLGVSYGDGTLKLNEDFWLSKKI